MRLIFKNVCILAFLVLIVEDSLSQSSECIIIQIQIKKIKYKQIKKQTREYNDHYNFLSLWTLMTH